jgi:hypothetical protein
MERDRQGAVMPNHVLFLLMSSLPKFPLSHPLPTYDFPAALLHSNRLTWFSHRVLLMERRSRAPRYLSFRATLDDSHTKARER